MDEIAFATVREFHRFAEDYPEVTKLNEDLKSFQRPWCVDRLLKACPNGGRILEIGADKCDLVPFLRSRGFEVWVIDVYDHFRGGTGTYEAISQKFPDMPIVRNVVPLPSDVPQRSAEKLYKLPFVSPQQQNHRAGRSPRIA